MAWFLRDFRSSWISWRHWITWNNWFFCLIYWTWVLFRIYFWLNGCNWQDPICQCGILCIFFARLITEQERPTVFYDWNRCRNRICLEGHFIRICKIDVIRIIGVQTQNQSMAFFHCIEIWLQIHGVIMIFIFFQINRMTRTCWVIARCWIGQIHPTTRNHHTLNLVGLVTFERQGFKVATIPVACLIDGFFFQCARAITVFVIGDFFFDHIKVFVWNIHQGRTDMGMVFVSLDKSSAKMHRNMAFDGDILVDGGCIGSCHFGRMEGCILVTCSPVISCTIVIASYCHILPFRVDSSGDGIVGIPFIKTTPFTWI